MRAYPTTWFDQRITRSKNLTPLTINQRAKDVDHPAKPAPGYHAPTIRVGPFGGFGIKGSRSGCW